MKLLSEARVSRLMAGFLLMGMLVVAGHHFGIVASADVVSDTASHHEPFTHPSEEHPSPPASVEAHAPTPIIQKLQLQKQLEDVAVLPDFAFAIFSPYRKVTHSYPTIDRVPALLPLDLKTTFLN